MPSDNLIELAASDVIRLDSFISEETELSRNQVQKIIKAGKVTVNKTIEKKSSFLLKEGDKVQFIFVHEEKNSTLLKQTGPDLEILYEDDYLLIIDKPKGLVCHPAAGHPTDTLVNFVYGYLDSFPFLVHRLDKDTSGLLVIAKDENSHQLLQKLWRDRLVEKKYYALCHGNIESKHGLIDSPIKRSKTNRQKMTVSPEINSKDAQTEFTVLKVFDDYCLLDVTLKTGRTHQIRVHFKAIGHSIVGDLDYGDERDNSLVGKMGLNRQFLHAYSLKFKHPVTGDEISIQSELASDLKAFMDKIS